jgi:hypothetical protein
MTRIALTDNSGKWFDADKTQKILEETYHNGNNWISKATGSQFHHESLYRTKGGRWILAKWSDYQGSVETYEEIDNVAAAIWLANQGLEPHPDCEKEYAVLEIL